MLSDENKSWLQVKGDPVIRDQVFHQRRQQSLFDERIDELMQVCEKLLRERNVFHLKIHFSSNQLTCWTYDNPYSYVVFVGDRVFHEDFTEEFNSPKIPLRTEIAADQIKAILEEFKKLRFNDESLYLRASSINRVNGIIGMTFSCDGSHYIPYGDFFATLKNF